MTIHIIDGDMGALYLAMDAPQSYHDAMGHSDVDGWVKAIVVKAENLNRRGVLDEVKVPLGVHIHDG